MDGPIAQEGELIDDSPSKFLPTDRVRTVSTFTNTRDSDDDDYGWRLLFPRQLD